MSLRCVAPPGVLHAPAPAALGEGPLGQGDDMLEVELREMVPIFTPCGSDAFLEQEGKGCNGTCL